MALETLKRRNKKDLKWPKIIIAILSTIGLVDTGSITLKKYGLFKGTFMGIRRIFSCHPFKSLGGGSDFDFVHDQNQINRESKNG